ncbi:MAG: hypothetical protein SA339_05345 [Methanomassiliicoccus sp.]|nr:hypothetical protein [Methanomassiliicoccus sp.]
MTKKRRMKPENDPEKFSDAEDKEPDDIYNEEARQELLEDDEITATEEGFMRGWDGTVEGGKKEKKADDHRDSVSVDLVKEQYKED